MYNSDQDIVDVNLSQEEKTWAIIAHALVLVGSAVAFGQIIGPLVIWLIKKDESPFVAQHAKESLNFSLSILIYSLICVPLIFVFIGIFLLFALGLFTLIVTILAIVRTADGQYYDTHYA